MPLLIWSVVVRKLNYYLFIKLQMCSLEVVTNKLGLSTLETQMYCIDSLTNRYNTFVIYSRFLVYMLYIFLLVFSYLDGISFSYLSSLQIVLNSSFSIISALPRLGISPSTMRKLWRGTEKRESILKTKEFYFSWVYIVVIKYKIKYCTILNYNIYMVMKKTQRHIIYCKHWLHSVESFSILFREFFFIES